MCVLAVQDFTTSIRLTKEIFDACWRQNDDGGGVGYYRGEEAVTIHSLDKDQAWANYNRAVDELLELKKQGCKWLHLLVHFRIGTAGGNTLNNCHPFYVPNEKGAILAHNGHTQHWAEVTPSWWSDTRGLAQAGIPIHAPKFWQDDDRDKIASQIGASKVAILSAEHLQLLQFPPQNEAYAKYGIFSNYFWDASTPRLNQGRFASGYAIMSNTTADKAIAYALANNLTFAQFLQLLRNTFNKAYPTSYDFDRFITNYNYALDCILLNLHPKSNPTTNTEIVHSPKVVDSEDLLAWWAELNNVYFSKDVVRPHVQTNISKQVREQLTSKAASNGTINRK